MAKPLVGLYTYAEFAACAAVFLPIMGASYYLHRSDPTQRTPGRWMRRFGRTTARLTPIWKFTIEGEAPTDIRERAYVVVANHESIADPFLLSFLPWDMRWVGKKELFDMPVLGKMMKFGGDIPLERGKGESVRAMFAECERSLNAGISVMMFPEGTRTNDGSLGAFKPGAFDLAIRMGVPVLPVALAGTRACRPKGSKWFGEANAIARILPAVSTTAMRSDDVIRLAEEARSRISEALPDLRARSTSTFT